MSTFAEAKNSSLVEESLEERLVYILLCPRNAVAGAPALQAVPHLFHCWPDELNAAGVCQAFLERATAWYRERTAIKKKTSDSRFGSLMLASASDILMPFSRVGMCTSAESN